MPHVHTPQNHCSCVIDCKRHLVNNSDYSILFYPQSSNSHIKSKFSHLWTMLLFVWVLLLVLLSDIQYIFSSQRTLRSAEIVQVPKLLRLGVFYEALCPDSRHYIVQQVSPTFEAIKDIIDLQLIPYGKATTHHQSDGTLTFTCQHGPKECLANKVHACVANRVKDSTKALKYIHCMIDINFQNIDPVAAGERCVDSEYWLDVRECSTTEKGDAILHHMGKVTDALNPRVTFIPTVTVNESQDEQSALYRNLKSTLCNMYEGVKPAACS